MRICIIYVVDYTNNVQDMEDEWRIAETADYICARAYAVVASQFPDELLKHAARVATALQAACEGRDHAVQVSHPAAAPRRRPPRPSPAGPRGPCPPARCTCWLTRATTA